MKTQLRSLLLTGTLLASAGFAPAQGWFFKWDGTTDITCVPTIKGNNAVYQGNTLRNGTNVPGSAASPTYFWELLENGSGGKAFRKTVTGNKFLLNSRQAQTIHYLQSV